jgi:RimJ/RimL family protein N-acetyltransferase
MAIGSAFWGPSLAGELVRLEPITPIHARSMLAGVPAPDLPWEDGFPPDSLLKALRQIVVADECGDVLGPFFAYVIIRSADGVAVGDAGFHGDPDGAGEVEIGYALVPKARGFGLAADAVRVLASWASTQQGVKGICALVDPGNADSERLLSRTNFRREGERGGLHRFVFAGSQ